MCGKHNETLREYVTLPSGAVVALFRFNEQQARVVFARPQVDVLPTFPRAADALQFCALAASASIVHILYV